MSSQRIFHVARRVIAQLAADPRTIALILIVPIVVLTVAGILIRAETTAITVGIIQQDSGADAGFGIGFVNLGERLTASMSTVSDQVTIVTLMPESADEALQRADVDAVITFPPEFTQTVMDDHAIHLNVAYEGSNPMAAQFLQGIVMRAAVETLAGLSVITAQAIPEITIDAAYLYGGADFDNLDYLAPPFIGLFVFLFVFILTSVSFLRERTTGTLERLQTTPISRLELVIGYMLGFSLFALAQSLIILGYTIFVLEVHYAGSLLVVFLVELLLALMAVNLGIFFSTFARSEFQVVQFIPLVVVTQILLSGAFWAISAMPAWLQPVAWLMPLTHANQALRDVMIKGFDLVQVAPYVLALGGFAVLFVLLSARTIRHQAGG